MPVLTKINTNVIADNAVTAAKTDQGADSSLSGTISGQRLQLSDEFTLTGDLTVNDDLVLGKVTDDGTGQSLTGSGKTITGTGTLTMGSSVTDRVKEFNQLAGNVTAPSLILTPSSAPSSPSKGQIYYNSTSESAHIYNGKAWVPLTNSTTGGNITSYILGSTTYVAHTFLTSGTFTVGSSFNVDYLIVAGGGGGGSGYYSGGGGAGGFRTATSLSVTAQTYSVIVGAGGNKGATTSLRGSNGGVSSFNSIESAGGGGGGSRSGQSTGAAGGSGGGASTPNSAGGSATPSGQGNAGGTNSSSNYGASGGGAGAAGLAGISSPYGREGAEGLGNIYRFGTPIFYAGGGAGGSAGQDRLGGRGGGGRSSTGNAGSTKKAEEGDGNSGGGGGGGSNADTGTDPLTYGANGGSGIVIIRYAI